MISKYLLLKKYKKSKLVQILDSTPSDLQGDQYRISPIYPVLPEEYQLPNPDSPFYVLFIYSSLAYTKIGAILNVLPREVHSKLWFSHGLASIIVISRDEKYFENILGVIGKHCHAWEKWKINNGKLNKSEFTKFDIAPLDKSKYQITDYSDLEIDFRKILNEFYHCINVAVAKSAQYCPPLLFNFEQLVKTINLIIEELKFLYGLTTDKPTLLNDARADELSSDLVKKKKRYHYLSSQLVQINSSISYIISQGFSGTVPIFENSCPVRSYSLLGIGTAYNALSIYSRHVESTFSKHPIAETITEKYGNAVCPQAFTSLRTYNPKEWKQSEYGIDVHLSDTVTSDEKPKLVYYSGRQGFRETKFSVSVPINILECAASSRWSLMTLSHELVHAHVMSIIAALFGDQGAESEKHFKKIGEDFSKYRREVKIPSNIVKLNLKDCLRFIILNYCCFCEAIKEKQNGQKQFKMVQKDVPPEKIGKLLADHFREINEIIVHVLDYNYFYNRNNDLYVGLLWESWSPVPIVIEKIEDYILRSLLAIGTTTGGDPKNRYLNTITELRRILIQIDEVKPGNIVIQKAINVLNNNMKPEGSFFINFMNGIYLADFANRFLSSKHINGMLLNDELRELAEDDSFFFYRLNLGDFEEKNIQSPIAFCSGLLNSSLQNIDDSSYETSWASAWTFLVCSSYKLEN